MNIELRDINRNSLRGIEEGNSNNAKKETNSILLVIHLF